MHAVRRLQLQALALASAGTAVQWGEAAAATAPDAGSLLDDRQDWLLGGGQFAQASSPATPRRAVSLMSLQSRQPRLIDVDFFPHGFAIHPLQARRVACFQKIGAGAALIDLDSATVIEKISPHGQQQFYGHGAFTGDGKLLLSTERDEQSQRGLIAVRDAKTMAYIGEFPSFGDRPHDCQIIESGAVLLVANGDGSVAYIDLKTQKLLEKLVIPNRKLNAGHLLALPHRKLVVVSAPARGLGDQDLGGISLRLEKAVWNSLTQPEGLVGQMTGEALSVVANEAAEIFGVTHPGANMVSFWSLVNGRFLTSISMPRPRGIELSLDASKFLLSFGPHAGLALVDAKNLKLIEQSGETAYFSGSHILNWSRAKRRQG